jgi:hypothetical protein
MPLYVQGSALYVGLLRQSLSQGKEVEGTTVRLKQKRHVWNVRESRYLGFGDRFHLRLDMYPHFLALLPANPTRLEVAPDSPAVRQGQRITLRGTVTFTGGGEADLRSMGQVAHVEVFDPAGNELEWFRSNPLFAGRTFRVTLPISYSEPPGRYTVRVEYPVTGLKAQAAFRVVKVGVSVQVRVSEKLGGA